MDKPLDNQSGKSASTPSGTFAAGPANKPGPQANVAATGSATGPVAKHTAETIVKLLPNRFDQPPTPPGYATAMKMAITVQSMLLVVYLLSMVGFLWLCFYTWPTQINNWFVIINSYLIGLVVVFFMIKPFIFPAKPEHPPITVTEADQPVLFAYVHRLCDLLRAPRPCKIQVTPDANASASYLNPYTGVVDQRFVLTLGLPLISGLTLGQLTGVVSHELGHFNQKAGFVVGTIASMINRTIYRIVFERDVFDALMEKAADSNVFIRIILFPARLCNWVNRGVLWLMMMLSYAMISRIFRINEFDADQYEVQMVGLKDFENTFNRLMVLSMGVHESFGRLGLWVEDKRLPDDIIALSVVSAAKLDQKHKQELIDRMRETTTKWYDTHPSFTERVTNAKSLNLPGRVQLNGPATVLFNNYTSLCRQSTVAFYESVLEKEFSKYRIVASREMIKEKLDDDEAVKSLDRYFQGYYSIYRPVVPKKSEIGKEKSREKIKAELERIRTKMKSAADGNVDRLNRMSTFERDLVAAKTAQQLIEEEVGFEPSTFGLKLRTIGAAMSKMEQCREGIAQLDKEMRSFDLDARARLELGITLLFDDQLMADIPQNELFRLRSDTKKYMDVMTAIEPTFPIIQALNHRLDFFRDLILVIEQVQTPGLIQMVIKENQNILNDMHKLSEKLLRVEYPFSGEASARTVSDYLSELYPAVEDIGGVVNCAFSVIGKFQLLVYRLLSKVVLVAEKAETRLGLELQESPSKLDPLADLAKDVDKKLEKKAQEEIDREQEVDMFFGENAKAAAVGVVVMCLLAWYFILSPLFGESPSPASKSQLMASANATSQAPAFSKRLNPHKTNIAFPNQNTQPQEPTTFQPPNQITTGPSTAAPQEPYSPPTAPTVSAANPPTAADNSMEKLGRTYRLLNASGPQDFLIVGHSKSKRVYFGRKISGSTGIGLIQSFTEQQLSTMTESAPLNLEPMRVASVPAPQPNAVQEDRPAPAQTSTPASTPASTPKQAEKVESVQLSLSDIRVGDRLYGRIDNKWVPVLVRSKSETWVFVTPVNGGAASRLAPGELSRNMPE